MPLKEKILINLSGISQKKLNNKKIPKKWVPFKFDSSKKQENDEPVNFIDKNHKLNISFLKNTILKLFISSYGNQKLSYENFSWTTNKVKDKSYKEIWGYKNNLVFHESIIDNQVYETSFSPKSGLIELKNNGKNIFSLSCKRNNTKHWLRIEITFDNDDYKCFGFGEQTNPMDKKGKKIIFWNTDNANYKIGDTGLYQSYPLVLFQYKESVHAFIFDNPAYSEIDLQISGMLKYHVNDLQLNMYVLLGPTYKNIMEQIKSITGSVLPIPKWSLGYQQSRWSYTPSKRVLEIAQTFREKSIPCDVIYLDIDYMDSFKCFTFGPDFSDYQTLIEKLHNIGFKVVPIIDPGIKVEKGYFVYEEGLKYNYFLSNHQGNIITTKVWPGPSHFPDFTNIKVQNWWAGLVEKFVNISNIDGIWCDMNEPSTFDARRTLQSDALHQINGLFAINHEKLHNIFGYLMSKATYSGLLRKTDNPFVMTRSTYLGGQKYATTWTGDNFSSWSHLQASIPMILSLGLSGQPVVGPDIGGFNGVPNAKLYERWVIQGAFYPYSRTHTAKKSPNQEPWSFGEEVEIKARKAIELRYKLLPYYYSLLYEAYIKGYPILRPIFFNYLNESTLNKDYYETEFLIGDNILVTPFMTKSSKRKIYLPPGYWYSWWRRDILYEGNITLTIDEKEHDLIPIFYKNEMILPMNTKTLQFIPDESLNDLSFLFVIADESKNLEYECIEYFDHENLLGIKITLVKENEIINVSFEEVKVGKIPDSKYLPKIIHFQINYFVRTIENLDKTLWSVVTDKDDWSEVTITDVSYPMNLQIELLF